MQVEWEKAIRRRERDLQSATDRASSGILLSTLAGGNVARNLRVAELWEHIEGQRVSLELDRRKANFLRVMDRYGEAKGLDDVLIGPPFFMERDLLRRLKEASDLSSVVRRMRGVHFEVAVAIDTVRLASEVICWYMYRSGAEESF